MSEMNCPKGHGAIAEAYRKQTGLLTGEEIKRFRKEKGMTQIDIAATSSFGVASIKRWETGAIHPNLQIKHCGSICLKSTRKIV